MNDDPTKASDDLPPHLREELEALAAMSDDNVDFSDVPQLTDFSRFRPAAEWQAERLLKMDKQMLRWFNAHRREGEDLPQRIFRALREYVEKAEQDTQRLAAE